MEGLYKVDECMKDFIIVGNKNALFYKEHFPMYMEGRMRFGYNNINMFILPDDAVKWKKIVDGYKLMDYEGTGRWFTSFLVDKGNPPIELVRYTDRYKDFDGFDAVNTDSIKDIPDTDRVIGCPIGIIDFLNDNQFKVVGKLKNKDGEYDFGCPVVEGKMKFVRILVKKI